MRKLFLIIILLLVIGCQTPQPVLEKPKEYKEVIQDVNREMEIVRQDSAVKKNPELQGKIYSLQNQINKLSIALKESEIYGKDSYQKYLGSLEVSKNAQKIIEKKDERINEIEDELSTWRKIKYTAYAIIGLMIIVLLFRLFSPIIMGLIRKSAGLP